MTEKVTLQFDIPSDSPYSLEEILSMVREHKGSSIISASELQQLFEEYPDIFMYRGGDGPNDTGEDYSFSEQTAIGWTNRAYTGEGRKKPMVIRIRAGDLDSAIRRYAKKKFGGDTTKAYYQIIAGGGSDYNLKIGIRDLNNEGCMPRRTHYSPLNLSSGGGLGRFLPRK